VPAACYQGGRRTQPQVLIVGAGPVGLTAASELARFGIPLRIVDKAAQRTDKSKDLVDNSCGDTLLDSFSAERSGVGDAVLKQGGRLTAVGTFKNPTLQSMRNHVVHFRFGLSTIQHAFADSMTEVSIGYPNSPLNVHDANTHGGPKPGERAPIRNEEAAVGSGSSPQFALLAEDTPASKALLAKYSELLESSVRTPYAEQGIWLVRPDGYIALAAKHDAINEVDVYLENLTSSYRRT
jgi:threonine dehydrogenase-like Zn-dependent dehydrogenase